MILPYLGLLSALRAKTGQGLFWRVVAENANERRYSTHVLGYRIEVREAQGKCSIAIHDRQLVDEASDELLQKRLRKLISDIHWTHVERDMILDDLIKDVQDLVPPRP